MDERRKILLRLVEERKDCLYSRELDVLTLLYGLDGGGVRSPEEVGQLLGVSAERVSQIERRAIRRLEGNQPTRPVRDFYC